MSTSADTREGSDPGEVRVLTRGSSIGMVGVALSQASLFLIVLVLAAAEGTAGVGVYSQCYALFSLATLVALFGARTTLTRFVADRLPDARDHEGVRALLRYGISVPLAVSVVLAVAFFLLAPVLGESLFDDPEVTTPLRVLALALPFASTQRTAAAALQGFGRTRDLAFATTILEPLLRLAVTVALVLLGSGVTGATVAILVSSSASMVWALRRLRTVARKRLAPRTGAPTGLRVREVLGFTVLTSVATIANNGLLWADTLVLGALMSSSDVGVYQVATRILALATLGTGPIATAFGPRIADLLRRGDHDRLRSSYALTTVWTTRLAVPALAICVIAPADLSRLAGGTGAAAAATVILAVGKLVEAATGPCGMVLNMSQHAGLNAANNVAALVLNVALNLVLVPPFGLAGAAFAWSAALVVLNVARSVEVSRTLRLSPDHRRVLGTIALGVGPALVGAVVVRAVPGLAGLALGSLLVVVVFAALVRRTDWTTSDTEVLRALTGGRVPGPDRTHGAGRERGRGVAARLVAGLGRRSRRRFSATSLTEEVPVDELVSPLRYDVVVRAQFLTFLREHDDLRREDPAAFSSLARRQPYFAWYQHVALRRSTPSEQELGRLFDAQVERARGLLHRHEAHGPSRSPIQLWDAATTLPTSTGKDVQRRYFVGDGCHRLALLMLDGAEVLRPDQVVVHRVRRFTPRDNTAVLLGHLALSDEDYYAYLARGYGLRSGVGDRPSLLAAVAPERRAELEAVLRVDDGVRAAGPSAP